MVIPQRVFRGDYIQGAFLKAKDPNGEIKLQDPGDLAAPAITVPFSYEHLHEAVTAAKRSFPSWRRMSPQDRSAALQRYRETLRKQEATLAHLIAVETGKPLWEAQEEIRESLDAIDYFLLRGSQTSIEEKVPNAGVDCSGMIRFLAKGVLVVIPPGAQPVLNTHTQMIPALMNGNTVVLKASKYAPFTGQALAEIAHESNLPSGVLNVVHGDSEAGRRLIIDPDVDGVLYTGNYEAAEKIKKQLLSDFWKTQVFQAGGKNALLIWDDAQYGKALTEAILASFITTGQRCTGTSRILLHEKIYDRFVSDFHTLSKKISIGYALDDKASFMGPLISEKACEDYLRFQGIAVREGAEEVMRGKALERDRNGYYVSPSIHLVQKPDAKSIYQKSEIHGPNVAIYKVRELDEAIQIMNQSQFGLVAAVYSQGKEIYRRAADELRVGILHWNRPTTHATFRLPFGGVRKSGNHHPMGYYAGLQCTYPIACLEMEPGSELAPLPNTLPILEEKP